MYENAALCKALLFLDILHTSSLPNTEGHLADMMFWFDVSLLQLKCIFEYRPLIKTFFFTPPGSGRTRVLEQLWRLLQLF